jgi:hypothetical protein
VGKRVRAAERVGRSSQSSRAIERMTVVASRAPPVFVQVVIPKELAERKEERNCERPAKGELPDLVERGSHEHTWNAINTEEDSTGSHGIGIYQSISQQNSGWTLGIDRWIRSIGWTRAQETLDRHGWAVAPCPCHTTVRSPYTAVR